MNAFIFNPLDTSRVFYHRCQRKCVVVSVYSTGIIYSKNTQRRTNIMAFKLKLEFIHTLSNLKNIYEAMTYNFCKCKPWFPTNHAFVNAYSAWIIGKYKYCFSVFVFRLKTKIPVTSLSLSAFYKKDLSYHRKYTTLFNLVIYVYV